MSPLYRRFVVLAVGFLLLLTPLASAAAVEALFDLASTVTGPFPSDRFTLFDHDNKTGLRVSLPKPDCAVRPTDCADVDVINTLDGFNLQPRLSIPFSGSIDVSSVSSSTVFLVRVGDGHGRRSRHVVGINQVVWDPATNTLHAESDEFLDQHTRYLLVVTDGVLDSTGGPVRGGAFADFLDGHRDGDGDHDRDGDRHGDGDRDSDHRRHRDSDRRLAAYREELRDALEDVRTRGRHIVAASVFTTQSATSVLEKLRDTIKSMPASATLIASFPRASVGAIQWHRQTKVGTAPSSFTDSFVPVPALDVFPGAVGTIAFGKFDSPDFETPAKIIPPIGTLTGGPVVQATNTLYFNLFVPAGSAPAAGWPVAIFGHGFTDSKQGAPVVVASTLAAHGIASIAINVVGHGGGAAGTLNILSPTFAPIGSVPDGGRGFDQNGDGNIDSTEGSSAVGANAIVGNRDGLRQTVADLMQLVHILKTSGIPGLDGNRIYYAGQSFGGIYGVKFLAVEPDVRAGVPNVPGGAIIEIARLSPSFRPLVAYALFGRIPQLHNLGTIPIPTPPFFLPLFNENIPLRNQPPVINTVPGAMAIQEVIENTEWVSQAGNPVAYAPHLRKQPLDGVAPRPFIIQFAKGDQTVPNPTATAILRAGDIANRATFFRDDLLVNAVIAANSAQPPATVATLVNPLRNPHTFLTNIATNYGNVAAIAAQQQIATFFVTDGALTIDPDPLGPIDPLPFDPPGPIGLFDPAPIGPMSLFEVPVVLPLPEALNF